MYCSCIFIPSLFVYFLHAHSYLQLSLIENYYPKYTISTMDIKTDEAMSYRTLQYLYPVKYNCQKYNQVCAAG